MAHPTLKNWTYDVNKGYTDEDLPPELQAVRRSVHDLEKRLQGRWKERVESLTVPEILYHYTDLAGLHGMITSRKFWLSDAAFMNDPLEGTWVLRRAAALVDEVLSEGVLAEQTKKQITAQLTAPDFWDQSVLNGERDERFWAAIQRDAMPGFIASFTEDGDLLSQWRAYGAGGTGVSVGFDLRDLELSKIEYMPKIRIKPIVMKVEYDETVQDDEIAYIFSEVRDVYNRHLPDVEGYRDAHRYLLSRFGLIVRESLYRIRWEFKSPHYAEEKEWRIIANPIGVGPWKSRIRSGEIVTFLEMPLPQDAQHPMNQISIRRIVMGPKCNQVVLRGIRGLLQNVAFPQVIHSKLSLR